MSFGGGSGGGQTSTIQKADPYAPAQPALNQIISEAGTIYGQGPSAAGYVQPTQQTLQGLAQQAATDVYSNVAGQFTGAGRTPGSPLSQATVTGQVAQKALPYAFGQLERERARQLQTAQAVPSLTAVGGALEDITRQQQMGPQASLAQYYNTIAPIAYGLPTQQQTTQMPPPNVMGMAGGGAMMGAGMGSMFSSIGAGKGAMYGGLAGLLGGLL